MALVQTPFPIRSGVSASIRSGGISRRYKGAKRGHYKQGVSHMIFGYRHVLTRWPCLRSAARAVANGERTTSRSRLIAVIRSDNAFGRQHLQLGRGMNGGERAEGCDRLAFHFLFSRAACHGRKAVRVGD